MGGQTSYLYKQTYCLISALHTRLGRVSTYTKLIMESSLAIVLTAMALFGIHCSGKDCSKTNYYNGYSAMLLLLTGQCSFEYRAQPPSTTLQGCNPYDQTGSIRIVLECVVRTVNTSYSIRWFRENTTGAVKDLGIGDPFFQQGNDRTSRYHQTAFFNQPNSPSLLGKYWCQVINTTADDPDQPLMRSNVFTLLAPGNYSGPTCTAGVQTKFNETCADLLDSQTTPVVLSTSQQLSSDLQPVQITTLLLPSTSKITVVPTTMSTTVRSSDNTFIFTSYNAGQSLNAYFVHQFYTVELQCTKKYHFTSSGDHVTTSSHPSSILDQLECSSHLLHSL